MYPTYRSNFIDDDYISNYPSLASSVYDSKISPYSPSNVIGSSRVHRSPSALPYSGNTGVGPSINDYNRERIGHMTQDFDLPRINESLSKRIPLNSSAVKFHPITVSSVGERSNQSVSTGVTTTYTPHALGVHVTPYEVTPYELRLSNGRSFPSYKGSTLPRHWGYLMEGRDEEERNSATPTTTPGQINSKPQQYDKVSLCILYIGTDFIQVHVFLSDWI